MSRIEETILRNLLYNEEYIKKVLPFLDKGYFQDFNEKELFGIIDAYSEKYSTLPTKEILEINLSESDTLTEDRFQTMVDYLNILESKKDQQVDIEWLVDETEKFCQEQAVYNALHQSISILDGEVEDTNKGQIPEILSEALSVGFDDHVGHDYFDDSDERFDYYHRKEEKVEFDLENFNRITKGGLSNKSLNIVLAGTGVGKSLFMCHVAGGVLNQGKNVLYITLEMAEEKIAERIDANLMDIPLENLHSLSKRNYDEKISKLTKATTGKLIVKEYPTAVANVSHFRHLLNELNLKKGFKPDIVFVDSYIGA